MAKLAVLYCEDYSKTDPRPIAKGVSWSGVSQEGDEKVDVGGLHAELATTLLVEKGWEFVQEVTDQTGKILRRIFKM